MGLRWELNVNYYIMRMIGGGKRAGQRRKGASMENVIVLTTLTGLFKDREKEEKIQIKQK